MNMTLLSGRIAPLWASGRRLSRQPVSDAASPGPSPGVDTWEPGPGSMAGKLSLCGQVEGGMLDAYLS